MSLSPSRHVNTNSNGFNNFLSWWQGIYFVERNGLISFSFLPSILPPILTFTAHSVCEKTSAKASACLSKETKWWLKNKMAAKNKMVPWMTDLLKPKVALSDKISLQLQFLKKKCVMLLKTWLIVDSADVPCQIWALYKLLNCYKKRGKKWMRFSLRYKHWNLYNLHAKRKTRRKMLGGMMLKWHHNFNQKTFKGFLF